MRQRELAWWTAMLPYLEKRPSLGEFTGQGNSKEAKRDRVRRFHAAWDKIDAALARSNPQPRGPLE